MFPYRNLFIILIIILHTAMAYCQTEEDLIKIAKKEFKEQQFENAKESYFFQWLQRQSEDVESDAIRDIHSQSPTVDLLSALGKMRQRFRVRVPDETLVQHGESWFQEVMQKVYDDLPAAGLLPPPPQRRMSAKTRV